MSHHLDTPLASQNGQLYIDDLYVFPGNGSTVLVMDVNSTITGADVQPGFHPEARYEFKVDSAEARNESGLCQSSMRMMPVIVTKTLRSGVPGQHLFGSGVDGRGIRRVDLHGVDARQPVTRLLCMAGVSGWRLAGAR